MSHVLIASIVTMSSSALLFYFLFFSKIENYKEILYPVTSVPLALYTILAKREPDLLVIVIAVCIWLVAILLPLWTDSEIICKIQSTYALMSFILASLVMVGKNI